jgi:2,4-dienoyl-CoA reductase-like NADH-dependent reductase (Old Yellow Enzyme family)
MDLFSPLKIRELTIRNRVFMSPMCQYSAVDGVPNNWHLVHLGTRAAGGVGVVIVEATGVTAQGRISDGDLGLWNENQTQAFKPIVEFIKSQGATPALQLAHAGRKASTAAPWLGGKPLTQDKGAWEVLAPAALPYSEGYPTPKAMTAQDEKNVLEAFVAAAKRAETAGFEIIEIHMAHGYLLHEVLSPLTNPGKSLGERMMFPLDVAKAVRDVWPKKWPVFVRISATDWAEGGWDLEQSVTLCQALKALGIDFIDVSSGGLVPQQKITVGPHYQVPFAQEIKKRVGILTGAVGMITDAQAAQGILTEGKADAVLLARELLRNPYWALKAAVTLKQEHKAPPQYQRAF